MEPTGRAWIEESMIFDVVIDMLDRDRNDKASQAVDMLRDQGFKASQFDWDRAWPTPSRRLVPIPPQITDPCEMSLEQLRWLRANETI